MPKFNGRISIAMFDDGELGLAKNPEGNFVAKDAHSIYRRLAQLEIEHKTKAKVFDPAGFHKEPFTPLGSNLGMFYNNVQQVLVGAKMEGNMDEWQQGWWTQDYSLEQAMTSLHITQEEVDKYQKWWDFRTHIRLHKGDHQPRIAWMQESEPYTPVILCKDRKEISREYSGYVHGGTHIKYECSEPYLALLPKRSGRAPWQMDAEPIGEHTYVKLYERPVAVFTTNHKQMFVRPHTGDSKEFSNDNIGELERYLWNRSTRYAASFETKWVNSDPVLALMHQRDMIDKDAGQTKHLAILHDGDNRPYLATVSQSVEWHKAGPGVYSTTPQNDKQTPYSPKENKFLT